MAWQSAALGGALAVAERSCKSAMVGAPSVLAGTGSADTAGTALTRGTRHSATVATRATSTTNVTEAATRRPELETMLTSSGWWEYGCQRWNHSTWKVAWWDTPFFCLDAPPSAPQRSIRDPAEHQR